MDFFRHFIDQHCWSPIYNESRLVFGPYFRIVAFILKLNGWSMPRMDCVLSSHFLSVAGRSNYPKRWPNYCLPNLPKKPMIAPKSALSRVILMFVEVGLNLNKFANAKIMMKKNAPVNMDSKTACPTFELMWSFFSIFSIDIVCLH